MGDNIFIEDRRLVMFDRRGVINSFSRIFFGYKILKVCILYYFLEWFCWIILCSLLYNVFFLVIFFFL